MIHTIQQGSFFLPQLEHLAAVSEGIAVLIGYIGILIILYGCAKGIALFGYRFLGGSAAVGEIRIELGQHLALGLEFLVGKDIIESLVQPTWDDLGKLAAIIAIRTVLTLFVARELKEVREELNEAKGVARHFTKRAIASHGKRRKWAVS
ncbi:MAG: DUF1622 domain-containing protein [Candidatus Peregrinibacteria bacterium]|nr:DUF1622 domain-containing protein [Candidatus Peregrinibacteria bacterium]